MPTAIAGTNTLNQLSVGSSTTVTLTYFNSNSSAQSIRNSTIDIWVPRNTESAFPEFNLINVSNQTSFYQNQLILFGFNLTRANASFIMNIKPENQSQAYLLALKFGSYPYIKITNQSFDSLEIFCPQR
jgi:hypothetical protein